MRSISSSSGATFVAIALTGVSLFLAAGASAQPVISSLWPSEGPTLGGTTLTLEGANLDGVDVTVTVGDALCPTTLVVPEAILCTTPEGTGLQEVRAHVDGVSSEPVPFQYRLPILHSVGPNRGPESGGTPVEIIGQNLGANASVFFGEEAAFVESQIGHHKLHVIAPPGTGTVPVVVVQQGGAVSSSIPFEYQPCPEGTVAGVGECSPCPAGTFVSPGASTCEPCPAGTFSAEPGSTACAACESGSVAPTEGLASCEACAEGLEPNMDATACGFGCASDEDCAASACELGTCERDGLCAFVPITDCCVDDEDCASADAGIPDDDDAGEPGDTDAGEREDNDAGEPGEIDAGVPGDIDAGDNDPACAVEDGCCPGEVCKPKDPDPPAAVVEEDSGVLWPGCAGSGMPSSTLTGLALVLLARRPLRILTIAFPQSTWRPLRPLRSWRSIAAQQSATNHRKGRGRTTAHTPSKTPSFEAVASLPCASSTTR